MGSLGPSGVLTGFSKSFEIKDLTIKVFGIPFGPFMTPSLSLGSCLGAWFRLGFREVAE